MYIPALHWTVLDCYCSSVHYIALHTLHCIVLDCCCCGLHCTALDCCCTTVYNTALHKQCSVLHCTALDCTATGLLLHWTALHLTATVLEGYTMHTFVFYCVHCIVLQDCYCTTGCKIAFAHTVLSAALHCTGLQRNVFNCCCTGLRSAALDCTDCTVLYWTA